MRRIVLFSLLLAALPATALAVWSWQHPLPQGNTLKDVHFVDALHGYAVGAWGTVVRTEDGGVSWQNVGPVVPANFESIHFTDPLTGVAAGVAHDTLVGVLRRTADGGATWQDVTPPGADWLNAVHLGDGGFGVAVGRYTSIWRTADGGLTWQESTSAAAGTLEDVVVTGAGTAVAVSTLGEVVRTGDAGLNWTVIPSGTTQRLEGVAFGDSLHGVVVGRSGAVRLTVDGGLNWWASSSGRTDDFYAVAMDGSEALAVGAFGAMIRSVNGGLEWQGVASPGDDFLYGASAGPAGLVVVGDYGTIFHSTDHAVTWDQRRLGPTTVLRDVAFDSGGRALAVGGDGLILRSVDAGLTWAPTAGVTAVELRGVAMAGPDTALAVGGDTVLRSVDGGVNWSGGPTGFDTSLKDVALADGRRGVAVGSNGVLLVTDDGGLNWTNTNLPLDPWGDFLAVAMAGRDTAVAVSFWGEIMRTTDGGANWLEVFSDGTLDLEDVCFAGHYGFAVGGVDGQAFLVSGDGGATWLRRAQGTPDFPPSYGVAFSDPLHGLIAHLGGIMVTVDGGTHWVDQTCPTDRLWRVALRDDGTALAVGNGGAIVRTVQSTWPSAVPDTPLASAVVLHPAVPNPFNPSTVLSWEMPRDGQVWLAVYDVRGRLVRTLVNGAAYRQGRHHAAWDGRDLHGRTVAAGVYLVRVRAGDGAARGRVLLLK